MRSRIAISAARLCIALALCSCPTPIPAFESQSPPKNDIDDALRFGTFRGSLADVIDAAGVAIDGDGTIYVTSSTRHRVHIFDAAGAPLRHFGAPGTAKGMLLGPRGIALDATGGIVVVDAGNHRIQVFDPEGKSLRSWGRRGREPGEFLDPHGLAIAGDRTAVADTGNHRVQVFDGNEHSFSIGTVSGGSGSGGTHLNRPVDVTFDAEGHIYVADQGNERIHKFSKSGELVASWGDRGPFPGLFSRPTGIDCAGHALFVTDSNNHRVQVLTTSGDPLHQWGRHAATPHEGEGALHYPSAVAVAPNGGFAVVCEGFEDRCQIFTPLPAGAATDQDATGVGGYSDVHYGPRFTIRDGLMAIPEPDTDSVMIFDLSHRTPIQVGVLGGHGRAPGKLLGPGGPAFNADGTRLFLGDIGNRRMQGFVLLRDPPGKIRFNPRMVRFMRSIAFEDARTGDASWPVEATEVIWNEGSLWVLDALHGHVHHYDEGFQSHGSWGAWGDGPGQFLRPVDMAMTASGEIVVVDSLRCDVQVFDTRGTLLRGWGKRGEDAAAGELVDPRAVEVAGDDSVYVIDRGQHRVLHFDSTGELLEAWGTEGLGAGELFKPSDLKLAADGRIFVLDHGNHRGIVYGPGGQFRAAFGARVFVQATRTAPK